MDLKKLKSNLLKAYSQFDVNSVATCKTVMLMESFTEDEVREETEAFMEQFYKELKEFLRDESEEMRESSELFSEGADFGMELDGLYIRCWADSNVEMSYRIGTVHTGRPELL